MTGDDSARIEFSRERSRSHDAQLVVFSQRNPQRPSVHLIHNKTQHRYFKKTSCQWLAPLRSGPSILGRDLSYECLFFFRSSCLPFCRSWTSEAGALFIFICFRDVLHRPAGDANRDLSEGYISVISRLSSGEREACLCRLHQGCCSTPDWDRWAVVLGMPDPIRWLRERMTGQKKNEERKTSRFPRQGWRRSAQTLCVIERREVTSCNWGLAVKVWDYSWS